MRVHEAPRGVDGREPAAGGVDQSPPPALFTDLYQLTMLQVYLAERRTESAVFELVFRSLPDTRNFMVAAGLDDVLTYLEGLRFTEPELAWLTETGWFSDRFIDELRRFRFTGDVWALPEGTLVFPGEPLVQIVAPLPEAQLVETYVLNQIHLQSVLASKAARVVLAARGKAVVDFGSRRAHGMDAALKVARSSYLVGAAGTSNVLAGLVYGIPVFGTMAHSYVQTYNDEVAAFAAFAREFPETTLLVDTYDTLEGVRSVIALARRLGPEFRVRAIRLDSGDRLGLAKEARELMDEAGLDGVEIFASGGLDEYQVAYLLDHGAPIDGFGVGTDLAVSRDAPALDMAYKLVEYSGVPRLKLSTGKEHLPGRKQVFPTHDDDTLGSDVIGLFDEQLDGTPLLHHVMQRGKRTALGGDTLAEARRRATTQLRALPRGLGTLDPVLPDRAFRCAPSSKLADLATRTRGSS